MSDRRKMVIACCEREEKKRGMSADTLFVCRSFHSDRIISGLTYFSLKFQDEERAGRRFSLFE